MRLEITDIDRPGFFKSDVVFTLPLGEGEAEVRLNPHFEGRVFHAGIVGQLREIAPDLYELLVDGVPVARPDGELHRIFGRAEAAIELAVIAKQEVKS